VNELPKKCHNIFFVILKVLDFILCMLHKYKVMLSKGIILWDTGKGGLFNRVLCFTEIFFFSK
jgi:hypothetical protein